MPYASMSARWARVVAVGEDAAVHLRVQGHHPVAEDRAEPGELGHVGDRHARLAQGRGGAAARHQVPARGRRSPRASSTTPVLSYTESRALIAADDWSRSMSCADGGGVEPALDLLDALVQRRLGVAGQDRHGLLGEDRPLVDLARWPRAPCSR